MPLTRARRTLSPMPGRSWISASVRWISSQSCAPRPGRSSSYRMIAARSSAFASSSTTRGFTGRRSRDRCVHEPQSNPKQRPRRNREPRTGARFRRPRRHPRHPARRRPGSRSTSRRAPRVRCRADPVLRPAVVGSCSSSGIQSTSVTRPLTSPFHRTRARCTITHDSTISGACPRR